MLVFDALSGLPLWKTVLLLLGVSTALTALAPFLVRRAVGFERLVLNNEIAGFQYSTLGTSYAVLLAMAVVAVWGDYRDAQRLVDVEAAAWGNMYQLAAALPQPDADNVQAALRDYMDALLDDEWTAMQRGHESARAAEALQKMRLAVLAVRVADIREATIYDHMLERMIELSEGRRSRLDMLPGSLPPLIDVVLVVGAVITISFTLFFGGKDVKTQSLMTGMLGLMINLVLLAAIELNYPFAGGVRVSSAPMESAMLRFAKP
jgi:hypothetical protein